MELSLALNCFPKRAADVTIKLEFTPLTYLRGFMVLPIQTKVRHLIRLALHGSFFVAR